MNDEGGGASRSTDPASGSSAATDVSLREHLTQAIGYERRGMLLVVGGAVAIGAFAWSEIQRRLEILNHENARLLAQQEKTVSHDTYAANESQRKGEQAEYQTWKREVDADRSKSISREEFQRDTKVERRAGISTTAAVLGMALGLVGVGLTVLAIVLAQAQ